MFRDNRESEIEKHLLDRFLIEKRLGRGAYGVVWQVKDMVTRERFALKKIFDAFQNETDSQRTYREICFLKEFSSHPNIIELFDVIRSNNMKDIYLVFEYMITDLDNVIRRNVLEDYHRRYIAYQICLALGYIHSANVVHRDLKPSNIVLNQQCIVKICDFGMARSIHHAGEDDSIAFTNYIATRWYRSPEVLLGCSRYSTKIDMWSFGCILGEMLKGTPLFRGNSSFNQLEIILKYFPPSTANDIQSVHSKYSGFLSKFSPKSVNISTIRGYIGKKMNDDSMKLLLSLLNFNPDKRASAEECFSHPYFKQYRKKKLEKLLHYDVIPPINDEIRYTTEEYRKILFDSKVVKNLHCEKKPHIKIRIRSLTPDPVLNN